MGLQRPFLVNIYYGGNIEYENGHIKHHKSTMHFTIVARDKMPYEEFIELIYKHIGAENQKCKLKITLHFEHCGKPMSSPIISDQTLDLMYFCAEKDEDFLAHVHVETEEIITTDKRTRHTNLSKSVHVVTLPCEKRSESCKEFGERSSSLNAEIDIIRDVSEEHDALDVSNISANTEGTDDEKITDSEGRLCIDDNLKEEENNIHLGMRFESKTQLKNAVVLWSVAQNKEFKVVESRVNTWAARCKIADEEKEKDSVSNCHWYVRGLYKKTRKQWQITKWSGVHSCPSNICSSNKNSNLTSTLIASRIFNSVKVDSDYSVKKVQADLKKELNVEVSYKKAWHVKRKARNH